MSEQESEQRERGFLDTSKVPQEEMQGLAARVEGSAARVEGLAGLHGRGQIYWLLASGISHAFSLSKLKASQAQAPGTRQQELTGPHSQTPGLPSRAPPRCFLSPFPSRFPGPLLLAQLLAPSSPRSSACLPGYLPAFWDPMTMRTKKRWGQQPSAMHRVRFLGLGTPSSWILVHHAPPPSCQPACPPGPHDDAGHDELRRTTAVYQTASKVPGTQLSGLRALAPPAPSSQLQAAPSARSSYLPACLTACWPSCLPGPHHDEQEEMTGTTAIHHTAQPSQADQRLSETFDTSDPGQWWSLSAGQLSSAHLTGLQMHPSCCSDSSVCLSFTNSLQTICIFLLSGPCGSLA
ncbi:uncharacterized protein LOC106026765 [Cavia porcellus]|uniref:uncharacterized protein LOC106026765 n=1 Tax=Cavia porcellus TaxID=10141 RepID=UPI002FE0432E